MDFNVSNCFKSLMFKCQSDLDTDFERKIKNSRFSANKRIGSKGAAPRWTGCDFQVFRMGLYYWSLGPRIILGFGLN